jgi:hypothetical protein
MFAPIIMDIAWESFIMPEFTKPTNITVVVEDDWITAVTNIPRSKPLNRLDVSFSKIFSSLPPASFSRLSPMTFIPYMNIAKPPISEITEKMSIKNPPNFLIFFPYDTIIL